MYTEKVIKAQRNANVVRQNYSLAYIQVQLALVSLIILGAYAMVIDYEKIVAFGLWHNFTKGAAFSAVNAAVGGLLVAAVLKYASQVCRFCSQGICDSHFSHCNGGIEVRSYLVWS